MTLRTTLDSIRSAADPPNEETAKFQILVPILQELGWNLASGEVLFEYSVGGTNGGRIDIALRGLDRVVAFIEAKAPRVDLNRHVEQVVKYAFHEGVDICVLTNGLEWWLYLPLLHVPFEKRRFETLLIRTDPVEELEADLESFLGRGNLVSGRARELAMERWKEHEKQKTLDEAIPRVWREMLVGPDCNLVDLVSQRVHESVKIRPPKEQVASVIQRSMAPPAVPLPPSPPIPDPEPSPPYPVPRGRPVAVRLWGEHFSVRSWIAVLLLVLESLHGRHGADEFGRVLNRLVSGNPGKFARPLQVGSTGFYINRSIPVTEIQRRSYASLNRFNYPSSDLEILSD